MAAERTTTTTIATKERMLHLLERQYANVEEYCDAQTKLGNLLVTRSSSTTTTRKPSNPLFQETSSSSCPELEAAVEMNKSLQHVKEDWASLQQLLTADDLTPDVVSLWNEHVALSERVLKTVYDPYHPNGIPMTTTSTSGTGGLDSGQTKLVALATLRASIARIKEVLK